MGSLLLTVRYGVAYHADMKTALTDYLTTLETAARLGLSRARIDQFARAGRLPCVWIGRARLFPRDAVTAFGRVIRRPGMPGRKKLPS